MKRPTWPCQHWAPGECGVINRTYRHHMPSNIQRQHWQERCSDSSPAADRWLFVGLTFLISATRVIRRTLQSITCCYFRSGKAKRGNNTDWPTAACSCGCEGDGRLPQGRQAPPTAHSHGPTRHSSSARRIFQFESVQFLSIATNFQRRECSCKEAVQWKLRTPTFSFQLSKSKLLKLRIIVFGNWDLIGDSEKISFGQLFNNKPL